MTITATETGIKITGSPPVSISSIVITDDNDVESTLDMSLFENSLSDIELYTGLELTLSGFTSIMDAFTGLTTPIFADEINFSTLGAYFLGSRVVNSYGGYTR